MAIVAAAAAAAYAPGLAAPPAFDDAPGILYNPRLDEPMRLLRYAWDPADRDGKGASLPNYAYRPLTEATYLPGWKWSGQSWAFLHVQNLALHAAGACLVLALVRRLAPPAALLSGLWFALHPLGTQAVTYVYQRATLLEALLGFVCLHLYLKARERPGGRAYAGALAAAFVATGVKETSATFPLWLLAAEWILRRPGEPWRAVLARWLPFVGVALVVPVQVFRAMRNEGWEEVSPEAFLTPMRYLSIQGGMLWIYAARHLVPVGMRFSFDPPFGGPLGVMDWIPLAGIACAAAWAMFGPAERRIPRLAVALLLAPQAMESSVFPIRDVGFFHRCYPGLLGGALLFGILVQGAARARWAGAALALLGILTFWFSRDWATPGALVRRDLRGAPRQGKNWGLCGMEALARGEPARAERLFRRSIGCPRNSPITVVGLSRSLEGQGRPEEGLELLGRAIRERPQDARALSESLRILLLLGRREEALALAERSREVTFPFRDAGVRLGSQLNDLGRPADAEAVLRRTLRNAPKAPEAWDNLGVALARQGKEAEAEAAHRRAIELAPDMPEAHLNVGVILAGRGDLDGAERELREALRLRPGYALAEANLALLRAARR